MKYIYNAKKVITDSFHATIFSVLFEKDFISFGRSGSESRVKNLLYSLDLSDCYRDICSFNCTEKDIPYDMVQEKIRIIRKAGEQYLIQSLTDRIK